MKPDLQTALLERRAELDRASAEFTGALEQLTACKAALAADPSPKNLAAAEKAAALVTRAQLLVEAHTTRLDAAQKAVESADLDGRRAHLAELERAASGETLVDACGPSLDRIASCEADIAAAIVVIERELEAVNAAAIDAGIEAGDLGVHTRARRVNLDVLRAAAQCMVRDRRAQDDRQTTASAAHWIEPAPTRPEHRIDNDGSVQRTAEHLLAMRRGAR